jgi:hypothetical protein
MTEELIMWVLLLGAAGFVWLLALAILADNQSIQKKKGSGQQPRIRV